MTSSRISCNFTVLLVLATVSIAHSQRSITVGDNSIPCTEDPQCINRLHPSIPMTVRANPGDTIAFSIRNAADTNLDPNAPEDNRDDGQFGWVHPLAGPVHIEGAKPGDVLKVNILDVAPGKWAWTATSGILDDKISEALYVDWTLNSEYAVSDDIPGVRLPNRSFPGVVTVLPGIDQHAQMLRREQQLYEAGGSVMPPNDKYASPSEICGEGGSHAGECLRTIPPREHGGNLDIRYLQAGSTIYLPCYLEGCGLAIGDPHYIQGDGEVSGTALEMDATVTVTTEILKDGPKLSAGPHFEGPSRLLDIPSERFYATTGFPIKGETEVPPHLRYLDSDKVGQLKNLSDDIYLAARNALLEMIDHISTTYGYTWLQAYVITSVAVDLRIGQLVDSPNVGVTAVLPLDIFE